MDSKLLAIVMFALYENKTLLKENWILFVFIDLMIQTFSIKSFLSA